MLNAPGELFEELSRAHRAKWTHSDELLALILQKIDELVITTGRAWSDPKKIPRRAPRPYRYPRPTEKNRKRKGSTPEEIRRFFRGK